MSDQIDSPTFHNQHLQSSLSHPVFDKRSELINSHPGSSRLAKYNTVDSAASFKAPENLAMHDLSTKSYEHKPPSHYDKQNRSMNNDPNDTLRRRPTLEEQSPSANPYYSRSLQHFNYQSSPQQQNSFDHENIKYSTISTQPGAEQRAEQERYARLENEIQNLKKTLIEKFEKSQKQLQTQERELQITKKKAKLEHDLNKTESDDEDNGVHQMESKRLKSRGKEAPQKEVKPPKSAGLTRSLKQPQKAHEETNGLRKELAAVRRVLNKEEVKKTSTSKARSGTKVKKTLEERYETLKEKNQELKDVCREYVDKAQDLEEILKSKDGQLENYEEEFKKKHESLIEKNELVFELKRQLTNREERIERITRDYEIRFREQDERFDRQQMIAKDKDNQYKLERDEQAEQIRKLTLELDIMTKKEAVANKNKEILQGDYESVRSELDVLKGELSSKLKIIDELARLEENRGKEITELRADIKKSKAENDEFRERIREIEQAKREIDDISARDRRMYEEHINRIAQEREREILKQKDKFEELREELRRTSSALDKTKEEKQGFENTAERLDRQKLNAEEDLAKTKEKLRQAELDKDLLEKEVDRVRMQKDEASRGAQFELERANRLESDNRKMESTLKTLEGRLEVKEKDGSNLQNMNDQMTDEIRGLLRESERSRDHLIKLERDLATAESQRSEDAGRYERKIEKLSKQAQMLEEENRMLKSSESRLNRELNTVKDEKEKYRVEYRDLRQTNKTLEKDLKELDDKVKSVILGRSNEVSEYSRDQTPAGLRSGSKSGSKLKVLDEIQDMIMGYRTSQSKYERNE